MNIIYVLFVPQLIVHLFHQQHDYIVNGNIISDIIKFRELINLTTKDEIKNFFCRRPNTKFRLIGTSSMF